MTRASYLTLNRGGRLASLVLATACATIIPACEPGPVGQPPTWPGDPMPPGEMAKPRASRCGEGAALESDVWKALAEFDLPIELAQSCAFPVGDDEVWITGGEISGVATSDVWVANLRTGKLMTGPDLPFAISRHACIEYGGEKLLLGGMVNGALSRETYVFDGAAWKRWNCRRLGAFDTCDGMLSKRSQFQAAVVEGYLCAAGSGEYPNRIDCHVPPRDTMPRYDLSVIQWYSVNNFMSSRRGPGFTFWQGRGSVMGGVSVGMEMDGKLFDNIETISTVTRDDAGSSIGRWSFERDVTLPVAGSGVIAHTYLKDEGRDSLFTLLRSRLYELRPPPLNAWENRGLIPGDIEMPDRYPAFARVREGFLAFATTSGKAHLYCVSRPR